MAAAAAAVGSGSGSGSGGGRVEVVEGEVLSEREVEVAAILADLPSIVRARVGQRRRRGSDHQQRRRQRTEIPTWGRRWPRTVPAAGKPVAAAAPDRGEGAASPDTPLAFPEVDEEHEAAAEKKSMAHEEWVQEQRGVVASLSHENALLLKQIEEFKARLQHSRSTNDSLKQMQSKHKKKRQRRREEEEEDDEERKRKLQARAVGESRPALGLDLNEPAEAEAEDVKPRLQRAPAQWFHRAHQQQQQQQQPAAAMVQHKAALTAAARRRRQEIRRAKAAARIRTG